MAVKHIDRIESIDWSVITGKADSVVLEKDDEGKKVTLNFDNNDIEVSDIIHAAMEVTMVKDIEIIETELADIVKEIYNHGL